MNTLPKHLRDKIEDMEPVHGRQESIAYYEGAEALWKILSESSGDEERAIEHGSYSYSGSLSHPRFCYSCCDSDSQHENAFEKGARFGLALGRVKAESEKWVSAEDSTEKYLELENTE